jgi:iron-sulfur cluster repair protein YtfE (RIC family)
VTTETQEPLALAQAHLELTDQLGYAVSLKSPTGEIARQLEATLKNHLRREDEMITPLLATFPNLAAGRLPVDAASLIELFERAEKNYESLLGEHAEITRIVERLRPTAESDREEEVVRFCDELLAHARLEEQVLYPAAVVAGRFMKLRESQRENRVE